MDILLRITTFHAYIPAVSVLDLAGIGTMTISVPYYHFSKTKLLSIEIHVYRYMIYLMIPL